MKRQPGGYAGQYKDADFEAQRSYYAQAGFKDLWFRSDAGAPDEARTRPEYGVWVTCLVVMHLANPDTLRLLDAWWIENANTTMQDQVGKLAVRASRTPAQCGRAPAASA